MDGSNRFYKIQLAQPAMGPISGRPRRPASSHAFGLGALAVCSAERVRSGLSPSWSMVPGFVYYFVGALALALALSTAPISPITWAI
jgi:hypothetical protein